MFAPYSFSFSPSDPIENENEDEKPAECLTWLRQSCRRRIPAAPPFTRSMTLLRRPSRCSYARRR